MTTMKTARYDLLITYPSQRQVLHHRVSLTMVIALLKDAYTPKAEAPIHVECVETDEEGRRKPVGISYRYRETIGGAFINDNEQPHERGVTQEGDEGNHMA